MKAPHTIDREIEVVRTIIKQLKECLKIFKNAGMQKDIQATIKDIQKCKQELKRLQNIRH